MVMSEFNQSNPGTNHRCYFGHSIVNTNRAQTENVKELLKVVQETNKSNHELITFRYEN